MNYQHTSVKEESESWSPRTWQASTVIVPLDGSVQALDALPVARALAKMTDSSIHLLHISSDSLTTREMCDKLKLRPQHLSDCIVEQRTGSAVTAEKWHSGLIVMCPYTGAKAESGLRSTGYGILANTQCAIVLVPPGRSQGPWSHRHLLLPHDGTPRSAIAVRPMRGSCPPRQRPRDGSPCGECLRQAVRRTWNV